MQWVDPPNDVLEKADHVLHNDWIMEYLENELHDGAAPFVVDESNVSAGQPHLPLVHLLFSWAEEPMIQVAVPAGRAWDGSGKGEKQRAQSLHGNYVLRGYRKPELTDARMS